MPGNPNVNMVSYAIRGGVATLPSAVVLVSDGALVDLGVVAAAAMVVVVARLLRAAILVPLLPVASPRDRGRPAVVVVAAPVGVDNGSNAITSYHT